VPTRTSASRLRHAASEPAERGRGPGEGEILCGTSAQGGEDDPSEVIAHAILGDPPASRGTTVTPQGRLLGVPIESTRVLAPVWGIS
jgi:hypothetical protein